jgi:hypothetical protein
MRARARACASAKERHRWSPEASPVLDAPPQSVPRVPVTATAGSATHWCGTPITAGARGRRPSTKPPMKATIKKSATSSSANFGAAVAAIGGHCTTAGQCRASGPQRFSCARSRPRTSESIEGCAAPNNVVAVASGFADAEAHGEQVRDRAREHLQEPQRKDTDHARRVRGAGAQLEPQSYGRSNCTTYYEK